MRVIGALATLVLFATFFSLPAWNASRRQKAFYLWDWGMGLYPVLFWLLLYYWKVGDPRPANFMELSLVGMFVMPASYLRAFVFNRFIRNGYLNSLVTIGLTLAFALAMRLIVPPLG
jgi:hypothetical protein